MASKRRNMFYQNKKQETTEMGACIILDFGPGERQHVKGILAWNLPVLCFEGMDLVFSHLCCELAGWEILVFTRISIFEGAMGHWWGLECWEGQTCAPIVRACVGDDCDNKRRWKVVGSEGVRVEARTTVLFPLSIPPVHFNGGFDTCTQRGDLPGDTPSFVIVLSGPPSVIANRPDPTTGGGGGTHWNTDAHNCSTSDSTGYSRGVCEGRPGRGCQKSRGDSQPEEGRPGGEAGGAHAGAGRRPPPPPAASRCRLAGAARPPPDAPHSSTVSSDAGARGRGPPPSDRVGCECECVCVSVRVGRSDVVHGRPGRHYCGEGGAAAAAPPTPRRAAILIPPRPGSSRPSPRLYPRPGSTHKGARYTLTRLTEPAPPYTL
ncbi:hypothetical protein AAG570_012219 [Ranatra chinensis]|uniref:Uncharacterized protein n=1 Tax=Ranatra chinensis TaxID=642074 RepID=A0ABD0Z0F3_9HEMI